MPLLNDLIIIFCLSIIVLFLCHKLRLPAIVGFLITGIIAGPNGLKLIANIHEVEVLAEIGVILLLFAIGIEFSLKNLLMIKRAVFLGGLLQVCMTIAAVFLLGRFRGYSPATSVFMGFLVALSSTAIVMKLFQERAEVDSPHGKVALAMLIFQDLAIVLMMLVTPMLSGQSGDIAGELLLMLLKSAAILALVFAGAQWIVPFTFYHIARTRSRELFMLSTVGLCLAVAGITYTAHLSLALGAFLAGLIISESEYSHQAMANILPFRDVFTSFFFVSVGMLLDISYVAGHPALVLVSTAGLLLLKTVITGGAALLLGYPLRVAVIAGISISQIGEFSFVLSKTGLEYNLMQPHTYQLFLSISVLTMLVTPFVMAAARPIADRILQLPLPRVLRPDRMEKAGRSDESDPSPDNHMVIIGFGMTGQYLAKAARRGNIPYTIIEMNPETVKREQKKGEPILFGDAGSSLILASAGLETARVAVVAISDILATRTVTQAIREMRRDIYIIVRTRFYNEMNEIYAMGADLVVPEEFETSVEIFTRVLTKYLIPQEEIEKFTQEVRTGGYQMLRTPVTPSASTLCDVMEYLPGLEIKTIVLGQHSPFVRQTLGDINLRNKYGVTVLGVRRGREMISEPGSGTRLHENDHLIVIGPPERVRALAGVAAFAG